MASTEFAIRLVGPKVCARNPCQEDVRFGPDESDEPIPESPDAEDRTVLAVASCKEFADTSPAIRNALPANGNPGTSGISSWGRTVFAGGAAGLIVRMLSLIVRPIRSSREMASMRSLRIGQLVSGKDALEHAASRRKADDDDVARSRDVLAEERLHHTGLDILHGLSVDGRITAGPCDRPGRKHEAVGLALQDAVSDQPDERPFADGAASLRRARDPVGRVVRLGLAGNVEKGGIEQVVVHRLRVDQEEPLGIRVDTVLECQIHQHRAGHHCISLMGGEGMPDATALGIDDQEKELLGHSQHGFVSAHRFSPWAPLRSEGGRVVLVGSPGRGRDDRQQWCP